MSVREFSNIVEYLTSLKNSEKIDRLNDIILFNQTNAKIISKIVFLLINSPDLGILTFFDRKSDKNRLNCEKLVGLASKLVTTFDLDFKDVESVLSEDEINVDFFDILYESDFGASILGQSDSFF